MRTTRRNRLLAAILLGTLAGTGTAGAAEEAAQTPAAEEKPPSPWSSTAELSLVVTEGNSSVETYGLKGTLQYKPKQGRGRLRIDGLRSDTSDDPYYLVEPGLIFEPGETPTGYDLIAVRPGSEPDVNRFFVESSYEGNLPKKRTWSAGASWDTNDDAGIVSRWIVFGGVGNVWSDTEKMTFRTNYALSYTDRLEDVEDPQKDRRFPGARLSWDFKVKLGQVTTYDNDFTSNVSLLDLTDYNLDLTQGVSVSMSEHLSLKVSLQLTYAGEPALEEVDVVLRALLLDPDGVPGNGDEYFQTVDTGGNEITIGENVLRKKQLDTTIRTTLQFKF